MMKPYRIKSEGESGSDAMSDNTRSKARTVFVVAVMCLSVTGMGVAVAGNVSAQETATADTAIEPTNQDVDDLAGSGTQDDPYIITDATELQLIASNTEAYYELGNDIDASETANWNGGNGFEPIAGGSADPFIGSLEGAGHTISGLTIDRRPEYFVGLFGSIGNSASVKNITLEDVEIYGLEPVGGLVGKSRGAVINANVEGTVYGSGTVGGLVGDVYYDGFVRKSHVSGDVSGISDVGGLVGSNGGIVYKSYATASVDGSEWVGGLMGTNVGLVNKTYATGDVNGAAKVGSLVGNHFRVNLPDGDQTEGMIVESYATGAVTDVGDDNIDHNVSGLVGSVMAEWEVDDAYWDTEATGQSESPAGTGLTTAEMTGESAPATMDGFNFEKTWKTTDDYPVFQSNSESDDGLSRFDQDDSGAIEFGEVLNAIAAHNSGSQIGGQPVTFADVLAVISAHNEGSL